MTALAPENMRSFTQRVTDFSKPTRHGDPIRLPKKDVYAAPTYLYFIYISFDPDSNLIVRQLREDGISSTAKLLTAEKRLFKNAVENKNVESTDFKGMVWDIPTYITIVVDKDDWKFTWKDKPEHDPVIFLPYKELDGTQTYDENYSFYDAEPARVEGPHGKKRHAVRCRNYVRNKNGPLATPNDKCRYCFEIYLEAPFSTPLSPVEYITILIDPDGQNQGPPSPVPPIDPPPVPIPNGGQ